MKLLATLLIAAGSLTSFAADSDPGYGPRSEPAAEKVTSRRLPARPVFQNYYRPLQYFYGDGYTVAYRLIPVDERVQRQLRTAGASEQMRVPAASVNTNTPISPRVFVGRPKKKTYSKPSRSRRSSAVRTSTTTTTTVAPVKAVPPVAEAPKP